MEAYERVAQLYRDIQAAKDDHWRNLAKIERLPVPETAPWDKTRLAEEETARHKKLEAELWDELDKAKREEQSTRAERAKELMTAKRQTGGYEV